MSNVGIDGFEIWTGKLTLDLAETFAPANSEEPGKYTKGLGLFEISLPDTHEDIVTMGANAAYRLLKRKGVSPDEIGRIDVATESAFDNSKPVSTYIAGCLEQVFDGDFHHANKGERKFACVAGTQSINDAYNWIKAGRHRGRSALVVATDTALYARGDPGEATQGAGAIAMLISEDPNLVELSPEQGFGSADETDFLKPNQQFPSVDGKRSIQVYLARMREALVDFEEIAGPIDITDYRFFPFHTPFPGMVRKAAMLGYRNMIRDTEIEDMLAESIGRQPREEEFSDFSVYETAIQEYMDQLAETDEYNQWYSVSIDPTMRLSRLVGNWYTGSVHIARASALIHGLESDLSLAGEKMLVGSYGSGAQAEVHAETIAEEWRKEIEPLDFEDRLNDRYELSFEEYEIVHDTHNYAKEQFGQEFTSPEDEFVLTGWGEMDERTYSYAA